MLTLVDCNVELLQDYDKLFEFLNNFPPVINMTLIPVNDNPKLHSCKQDEKNPDNIGLSGFSLLWESHLSIHTWPVFNEVDIDVFSCYPFNIKKTITFLESFFSGRAVNVSIVDRGNNEIIGCITPVCLL